jgi:hypothetical protein
VARPGSLRYRAGSTAANAAGGAEVAVRRSTALLVAFERHDGAVLRVDPPTIGDDRAHAVTAQQGAAQGQRAGVESDAADRCRHVQSAPVRRRG